MSIERIYGDVAFICDDCNNVLETGDGEFAEALANAKMEGWVSLKEAGVWNHYCSGCRRKHAVAQR